MSDLENGLNGTIAADVEGTVSLAATKMPVGDLFFEDTGKRYRYAPQEDITPQEVSHIAHLFLTAAIATGLRNGFYDYLRFIADKKLTRHFEEVK